MRVGLQKFTLLSLWYVLLLVPLFGLLFPDLYPLRYRLISSIVRFALFCCVFLPIEEGNCNLCGVGRYLMLSIGINQSKKINLFQASKKIVGVLLNLNGSV